MNKNFPIFLVALAACLTLTSCAKQEIKTVTTTDAENVEQVIDAEVEELNLDESIINWAGYKITGSSHEGTLKLKQGEILTNEGELVGGSFVIDMTTLENTDLEGGTKEKFEDHMQAEDYFDIANHPEAKFEITKIIPTQETNVTHTIFGNLELKGASKNISFKANVQAIEDEFGVTADFNLKRSDWNIGHSSEQSILDELKDNALKNEFNIKLDLKG